MNRAVFVFVLTGLISLGLSVGCGGGDEELPDASSSKPNAAVEKASEKPMQATTTPVAEAVPTNEAVASPEARALVNKQLATTIELPDYYPSDGPVYPGAQPSLAQQLPNGRVSLLFRTDASADEAASVMSEAAEAKGWTVVSDDAIERGHLTRASKDGRELMLLTNRLNEGTPEAATVVAVSVDP